MSDLSTGTEDSYWVYGRLGLASGVVGLGCLPILPFIAIWFIVLAAATPLMWIFGGIGKKGACPTCGAMLYFDKKFSAVTCAQCQKSARFDGSRLHRIE